MDLQRCKNAVLYISLFAAQVAISGCTGGNNQIQPALSAAASTDQQASSSTVETLSKQVKVATAGRPKFLGAFFRAAGSPPYGVFEPQSSGLAPQPYPTPGGALVGPSSYCDGVAANGASIDTSWVVDPTKLSDVVNLGVGWTRLTVSQFFTDESHIFGPGQYAFGMLDAAQCVSFAQHGLRPIVGLEAGPVEYNAVAGQFSPQSYPTYKTAADFGQWCGVVAAHEKAVFGISQFSMPGNEVNSNPQLFPGGESQIASYSKACYSAIKAANPNAFVYGFELNMDGSLDAPGFVSDMFNLGCKVGTCYDGIAIHLSLRYPIPSSSTPCYPKPGGDYSIQCVSDIQSAAHAPSLHILISETVYTVPDSVPDENTKALAVVAAFKAFAAIPTIDGVNYANVDECAEYPTGYFSGGCLIDTSGNILPAYTALQALAQTNFL